MTRKWHKTISSITTPSFLIAFILSWFRVPLERAVRTWSTCHKFCQGTTSASALCTRNLARGEQIRLGTILVRRPSTFSHHCYPWIERHALVRSRGPSYTQIHTHTNPLQRTPIHSWCRGDRRLARNSTWSPRTVRRWNITLHFRARNLSILASERAILRSAHLRGNGKLRRDRITTCTRQRARPATIVSISNTRQRQCARIRRNTQVCYRSALLAGRILSRSSRLTDVSPRTSLETCNAIVIIAVIRIIRARKPSRTRGRRRWRGAGRGTKTSLVTAYLSVLLAPVFHANCSVVCSCRGTEIRSSRCQLGGGAAVPSDVPTSWSERERASPRGREKKERG